MPYVQCEEAGCDYPDLCMSDHWVPSSADEARQYLAAKREAEEARRHEKSMSELIDSLRR